MTWRAVLAVLTAIVIFPLVLIVDAALLSIVLAREFWRRKNG